MKNLSLILSIIAVAGVAGLFFMQQGKPAAQPAQVAAHTTGGANLAYVDIDSLEAHYDLLKTKREDFRKKQAQMEAELQRSYGQLQNDAGEMQKRMQANNLTQSEYEAAQKRLMQMQQSLESRKESLTQQLMKEQEDFNADLKRRLDSFLAEYNKTHHYDFILSYSGAGSAILYADRARDITTDVVAGMNAGAAAGDEIKKK